MQLFVFLSKISAFNKQCYEFKRVYFILVVLQPGCISEPSGELVKKSIQDIPTDSEFPGVLPGIAFFHRLPTVSWSPMTSGDFCPRYTSFRAT